MGCQTPPPAKERDSIARNVPRGHSGDLENPLPRKGGKPESPLRVESGWQFDQPCHARVGVFKKQTRVKGKAGEKDL